MEIVVAALTHGGKKSLYKLIFYRYYMNEKGGAR